MAVITLGITGSIAACKAPELASQLVKLGHEVHVVMTRAAREFVAPLTMQVLSKNPVTTELFDEREGWRPGHIELADRSDLLLVAPATAHLIAQFALGLAPDALTSIHLATRAPVLIAPAMNGKMWLHPATAANVATLRARGVRFIGPDEGMLACGYEGCGRLWPVAGIVAAVADLLG
jgi:phosphopantothenoylcysteine decarboxylase